MRVIDRVQADRPRPWALRGVLTAIASLLMMTACGAPAASGYTLTANKEPDLNTPAATLTGAGSTFDQPFFTRAFYFYHRDNPKVTVNYASIGSGGGIAQFQANTVNFGASDVPMSSTDIAAAKGGSVLQIPVALGGEAISYNLYGIGTGLHFTGPVLAEIFLGTIKKWNDPAIKALNPKVKLPDEAITVVHRSDGSGTTYIFTNYLSTVSSAWRNGPGTGKLVAWPVGVGGKGNEGVAGSVKEIQGSIGYVESAYALQNNFTSAVIKNKAGKYVAPTLKTVAVDAAKKPNVTSTDFSIVDEAGATSYPISGYSWALVYQKQSNAQTAEALAKMLDWLTHSQGQAQAKALDYVPLPPNIQQLARSTIKKISTSSGKSALAA